MIDYETDDEYGQSLKDNLTLLRLLICSLVDYPNDVSVRSISAVTTTILEVKVHPEDVRRIIGRKGRTASAIREILTNLGAKVERRYHLEILEPSNRVTVPLNF